jgi:exodeoxyribonuclease VII small subunit
MAKKQTEDNPFEKVTFEQAIETLSGIVQKIETGQVPLQESLRQYEQGMGLIQHCRKILLDAEKRIEMIGENQSPAAPAPGAGADDEDEDAGRSDAAPESDDESLF